MESWSIAEQHAPSITFRFYIIPVLQNSTTPKYICEEVDLLLC